MPPIASADASMNERAASSSLTSTSIGRAASPSSEARLSRRSSRRAPSATVAPSATSARAVASPMPDEAPVIATRRPLSDSATPQSYGRKD